MIKQKIEQALSGALQRDIQVICNNKTLKQGKLINYSCSDYVVSLTLRNNKSQLKNYDMYYPYDMCIHDNEIQFDYTMNTLSSENDHVLDLLSSVKSIKTHKHYDSVVCVKLD